MLTDLQRQQLAEVLSRQAQWVMDDLLEAFPGEGDVRKRRAELALELRRLGWERAYLGRTGGKPDWRYCRDPHAATPEAYLVKIGKILPFVPQDRLEVLVRLAALATKRDPESSIRWINAAVSLGIAKEQLNVEG